MFWIGLAIAMIGMAFAQQDYDERNRKAKDQRQTLTDQARETAQLAIDKAQADLETQLGQLGTLISGGQLQGKVGGDGKSALGDKAKGPDDNESVFMFDSYDDWYNAQQGEYDELVASGEFTDSFQEYLRSQQITELGQYGLQRAQLELNVMIARRELELAREDVQQQFEFAEWVYDEGVIQSNRATRGDLAFAASGMRGGTAQGTATENQRVRMAELDLFMGQSEWARDLRTSQLDIQQTRIDAGEQIGLAGLDQALAGARTSFDFAIAGINLDYQNYLQDLNYNFNSQFNTQSRNRAIFMGGAQGASLAMDVFATGHQVGAWGFDASGSFWTAFGGGT
jgi:hypothetical protein